MEGLTNLPTVYNQPGAAFVLLRPGAKFPPVEKEWEKKPHTFEEAAAHKGNVGVLAGNGYIGLDKDVPSAFEGLQHTPSTSWETRPGRSAGWFTCTDFDHIADVLAMYGKKPDLAQIMLFKNGKHVGEIKLQRSYQVIPPSWKRLEDGTRADYKMLVEVPPAEISLEMLLSDLQALGITFSSKLEQNAAKLERVARESRQRRAETDEMRIRRYAEAALKGEVEKVRNAADGDRNAQLFKSAAALGEIVAAGVLSETEVSRALSSVAKDGEPGKIPRTIQSGLETGARHPREIPAAELSKESNRLEPKVEEISSEIHTKALEILQRGDPIQYISDSCGRMVLGADKAFRKLTCCAAVQGVRQSMGLHAKFNGESGSGKTLLVLTFAHHLPPEAVVTGSFSNLSAFYHQDGDRVFRILDDYQAGNETLDTIIKQTSSVFHLTYDHRTVKKQEPIVLSIGSEQTWIITSVNSSQDIQVLNRQIPINVDDSEDLTREVNARTIERYGKGEEQFPEDETVQICCEIWRILRADGLINVRVPFWERIEWLDVSNRRNPSIFMDLLIAHTAMNRYQREQDAEGFYLATEDDFQAAKALFTDKDAEELVHRLTRKERELADLLSKYPSGLTREEVAMALGISVNRVSQLANGEKGKGGLMQKLPGFCSTDIIDSEIIDAGEGNRRSTKRILFKLSRYDPLTGFDAVVKLKPIAEDAVRQCKDGVRNGVRIDECKETSNSERENREKERESKDSKEKVREDLESNGKSENSSPPLSKDKKSLQPDDSATDDAEGILTPSAYDPYYPYTEAEDSERKSLHPPESCLWGALRLKLRKYGRIDGKRRGLAASDLTEQELHLIRADGWTSKSIETTGLPVWWAPEKTLEAMGLEVPPNDSHRSNDSRQVESYVELRFLQPVPAFVGASDLKTYGPFDREDVATIPSLNAVGLITRGFALRGAPGHA